MSFTKKPSSIYSKTNSNIETIVDKILEEKKDKLSDIKTGSNIYKNLYNTKKIGSQDINLNFSLEKKNKKSVYFVRKKSVEKNMKTDLKETKKPNIKAKRHLRIGKAKQKITLKDVAPAPSKEDNEIVSQPDKSKKLIKTSAPIEGKKSLFEKKEVSVQDMDKHVSYDKDITQSTSESKLDFQGPKQINKNEAEWLDKKIKEPLVKDNGNKKYGVVKHIKPKQKLPIDKTSLSKTKSKEKTDKGPLNTTNADTSNNKAIPAPLKKEKKELRHRLFSKTKSSEKDAIPMSQPNVAEVGSVEMETTIKNDFSKEILQLKSSTLKNLGFSEKTWEELDFYPLHDPFAFVEITRDTQSLDKRYVLIEVELSGEELKLLKFLQDTLATLTIDTNELESKGINEYLREKVKHIIEEYEIKINESSKHKVMYYLEKEYLGLGKIDALMRDPHIEDISCDGANVPIFLYHRKYGSLKSNINFGDEDELSAFVVRLAQKCGKHISIAEPMLDATMPDGSRVQMTLSTEVTAKGSTFTIRKFKEDPFSPPDLIEFNTLSSEMIAYMWMAIENKVNALIAGGTASGKTSTLNALSLFIPREAKIVSIEETREINLPHPNWIPGVARSGFGEVVADKMVGEIDMYDLMKAALRQRPEYILVGEIRGKEAYVLFQAMATGHTTYSTAHADSAQSLIHRLEGKPINIPRIMLQALDIVLIQVTTRVKNKRARRCKQIIEIIDIDPTTKEILTNEVFRWDPIEDKFIYSGKSYVLESIRADKDLGREEMTTEIKNRARLLEWMNSNNIRDFKQVATLLAQYADDPISLMKRVGDV